jgi:retron-type reverse transcriptase
MTLKKKNLVKKVKNFTLNFGPQHPAAHGVLRCAGRTHCKVTHSRHIDWHYFFSSLLGSLLRICLVMFRYKKYHQFCFKQTMGVGVKRFNLVVKTSVNHPQARIGGVSRLHWASTFLNGSSLIPKRLRFYSLASNCVKPVQTIHLAMSTYTFNYYVRGEIRKKTWLNKSTCHNNKLAPKFRNFCSSIQQTSALVLVKTNESEHSSLASNLVLNKTCEVSLDTILFIERMNKIEDNKSILYQMAFSKDSLLVAYDQIKSKSGNLTPGQGKETLKGINLKWFKTTSSKLLKGLFIYPKMRRVWVLKKLGSNDTRPLTLTSPRIKIIERSILNAIEPVFEGKFKWKSINKSEYDFIKNNNNKIVVVKNKSGYFKKDWVNPPIFSRFSFGFRPNRSPHGALNLIKNWPINLSWFIKFDVVKAFDIVNRNRLKNIFLKYCPEHRIWSELNKLMKAEIIGLNTASIDDLGVSQGSVLSPFQQ